ncbi:hypothetical protein C1646_742145 [Rhizophagus diaphanus]|nr:hypothetical protein C1646_742145 [Rhizophagus diaphanus] [Rhizophagus sp. MUCL 43196]
MSCSKIFSGDLPELTYDIIKYFQKDISTLYSCILVNRLWCRLAIPLLWENPFLIPIPNKNHKIINIIEIYLNNLNEDFKMKLYEYKIINNSLPSKNMLLFDYLKFLKYLNTHKFIFFVETWISIAIDNLKPENILYDTENFKRLVHKSLFKIFIENEVNLNTLEIEISGQILPSKLDYISLELTIEEMDFRVFLENSQYSLINKLLILQCGNDDILHYIKDYYIMKKKRVKCLAIKDDKKELFDLKDEVRELELHNIKVRRHSDLNIKIYDFIKEY